MGGFRASLVELAEFLQVLVESRANRAVCIVVAELARGLRADLLRPVDHLTAEVHELLDARVEAVEFPGVGRAQQATPLRHHLIDAIDVLQLARTEFLRLLPIRRHVDAARFHHDRKDQTVDLFDADRALRRCVHIIDEALLSSRLVNKNGDQRQSSGNEKGKNGIKLCRNGKLRQHTHRLDPGGIEMSNFINVK